MMPLATVLIVLVSGGASAAAVLVIRHPHAQPTVRESLAALAPTTTSAPPPSAPSAPPASPTPAPSPTPSNQVSMDGITIDISAVNTDPDASAVATTFATYFGGIDARNYTQAWSAYSASFQGNNSYDSFANNDSTTQDTQVVVQSIQQNSDGSVDADVSFQSQQAGQFGPDPGETCTNWSLDYDLVPAADPNSFLINGATAISGSGHSAC